MRSVIAGMVLLLGLFVAAPPCVVQTVEPAGCDCKPCLCGADCVCDIRSAYVDVCTVETNLDRGFGSGTVTVIDGRVVVLTAKHVVDKVWSVKIGRGGKVWDIERVVISPINDLAALYPRSPAGLRPMGMGVARDVRLGEPVDIVHGAHRLSGSFTRGRVFNTNLIGEYLALDAPTVTFGASGSGVYTVDRVLVGIVSRSLNRDPRGPALVVNRKAIDAFVEVCRARPKTVR